MFDNIKPKESTPVQESSLVAEKPGELTETKAVKTQIETAPQAAVPLMLRADPKSRLVRAFIYGRSGLRKTWWATKIVEQGFNVVYVDGDDSAHVLRHLNQEAISQRLYHLRVVDMLGLSSGSPSKGKSPAIFFNFLWNIVGGNQFIWNFKKQAVDNLQPDKKTCIRWTPSQLGPDTVLIVDSYTALIQSLKTEFFHTRGVDLSSLIDKAKGDQKDLRDHYQWCGMLAATITSKLKTFNCHVIVIGHEDIQEKFDEKGKLLSTRTSIIGSSRNQSANIARDFSDVLHVVQKATTTYINTKSSESEEAQSRVIAPDLYKYDDLSVADLFEAHGALMSEERKAAVKSLAFQL